MAVIEEDEAKGHTHAHTHGDKPCSGHDNVEKVPQKCWGLEACLLVRGGSRGGAFACVRAALGRIRLRRGPLLHAPCSYASPTRTPRP